MKNETKAFGVLGLVIVLLIVAFLVVFQWERIESWRSDTKETVDEKIQVVDDFQEDIKKIEKDMQERLDKNLNP